MSSRHLDNGIHYSSHGHVQGEQDRKSRALSYLTLDLDRPAMGLDDPVHNRQPQSAIASFGTYP
jgi:hypothetical protein